MEMTKKIYLETLKSVLGRSILNYSLNVSKTELIIFKPRMKKTDFDLKLNLNGKRIYPTKSVKCLRIKSDD